jgi:hypothetical protein
MEIFIIENNVVKPSVEILLLYPFNEIWERDTSENKSTALKDFKFIEFFCSFKKTNPFCDILLKNDFRKDKDLNFDTISNCILDETYIQNNFKDREFVVKKEVYGDGDYLTDDLILKAVVKYEQWNSENISSISYYRTSLFGAEKLKSTIVGMDFSERTTTGSAVYKPTDLVKALENTDKICKNLITLKEQVYQDVTDSLKTKSNKTINSFEK